MGRLVTCRYPAKPAAARSLSLKLPEKGTKGCWLEDCNFIFSVYLFLSYSIIFVPYFTIKDSSFRTFPENFRFNSEFSSRFVHHLPLGSPSSRLVGLLSAHS